MTAHAPIPDFAAARQAMVDGQLKPVGVTDPLVIAAMGTVERERFVPGDWKPMAYMDRDVPLADGRKLTAPSSLGILLDALAPVAGERALVVAAGTGYSAAVLRAMGLDVTALEESAELAAAAKKQRVAVVEGSLADGYGRHSPYDLILIDGAVEHVPEAIVDQLRDGGRLGAAVIDRGVARLVVGVKAAGGIGYRSLADAGMAALPGFRRPRAFTF